MPDGLRREAGRQDRRRGFATTPFLLRQAKKMRSFDKLRTNGKGELGSRPTANGHTRSRCHGVFETPEIGVELIHVDCQKADPTVHDRMAVGQNYFRS